MEGKTNLVASAPVLIVKQCVLSKRLHKLQGLKQKKNQQL